MPIIEIKPNKEGSGLKPTLPSPINLTLDPARGFGSVEDVRVFNLSSFPYDEDVQVSMTTTVNDVLISLPTVVDISVTGQSSAQNLQIVNPVYQTVLTKAEITTKTYGSALTQSLGPVEGISDAIRLLKTGDIITELDIISAATNANVHTFTNSTNFSLSEDDMNLNLELTQI